MLKKLFAGLLMSTNLNATDWIDLWPGQAPGAAPLQGTETSDRHGHLSEIEQPQYLLVPAEKPTGQGVLIFPGGGYGFLSMTNEGVPLALEFAARGITAMVVKYRVSQKDESGYQFPVPLLDARRAIRTMRAKAQDWKIDPKKVGVIGFSAGGHLAACTATLFNHRFQQETSDAIDKLSCRPDFHILVYPVIGMGKRWVHGGSQRRLLGHSPSAELIKLSNPLHSLQKTTPPLYFVHSADDGPVPLRNTSEYIARCAELQVPLEGHIYPNGGHGWGLKGRATTKGWTQEMFQWVSKQ